ncbi:MAG: hypothetical protein WAV31_00300 [Candidatus Moraniibacteriota bacterium]
MFNNFFRKKLLFLLTGLSLMPIFSAQAFCPVCVVAVGAGLELSNYLGIDDTVTGLWIGALLVSLSMWTIEYLAKKKINFFGKRTIIFGSFYFLTVAPLYWKNLIGQPMHSFWGIDKLVLGMIIGSILFFFGGILSFKLKQRNGGKVYFPFQKVIIPLVILFIASGLFYYLTLN